MNLSAVIGQAVHWDGSVHLACLGVDTALPCTSEVAGMTWAREPFLQTSIMARPHQCMCMPCRAMQPPMLVTGFKLCATSAGLANRRSAGGTKAPLDAGGSI